MRGDVATRMETATARWAPDERTTFTRRVRREMTRAEALVWRALRSRRLAGAKFRRQVLVELYIADSPCREAKLVVELDGAAHDDPDQKAHGERRDARFEAQDLQILRFRNGLCIAGAELAVRQIEAGQKTGRHGTG